MFSAKISFCRRILSYAKCTPKNVYYFFLTQVLLITSLCLVYVGVEFNLNKYFRLFTVDIKTTACSKFIGDIVELAWIGYSFRVGKREAYFWIQSIEYIN